jgi:hypothetical protein
VSEASEPGIHNPGVAFSMQTQTQGIWIPGLRQEAHPGMTSYVVCIPRLTLDPASTSNPAPATDQHATGAQCSSGA